MGIAIPIAGGGGVALPDTPTFQARIGVSSPESVITPLRSIGNGYTANAWGTANLARYIPFSVGWSQPVMRLFLQTNTTANCDIGIYTEAGTLLVSSGSFAGGGDAYNVRDVTDITLAPGCYYFACAVDSGGGQVGSYQLADSKEGRVFGYKEQTSAFPLPSTATFATSTGTVTPVMGLLGDTTS